MDTNFMESEWWVFQTLWQKGQVYKGHRVMPYSLVLTTALSNFEAKQNYQDFVDPTVVVFDLVTSATTHCRANTGASSAFPSSRHPQRNPT